MFRIALLITITSSFSSLALPEPSCRLSSAQFDSIEMLQKMDLYLDSKDETFKNAQVECIQKGGDEEYCSRIVDPNLGSQEDNRKALSYVESLNLDEILSDPSRLLSVLNGLNQVFFPNKDAGYRKEIIVLPAYPALTGTVSTPNEFALRLLNVGGVDILKAYLSGLEKLFEKKTGFSSLSDIEYKALSYRYFLTSDPEKLDELMQNFSHSLVRRLSRCKNASDFMAVASYAHNMIIRIHPYSDGNGRLARFLANMILAHGKQNLFWPINRFSFVQTVKESLSKKDAAILAKFIETGCH